MGEEMCCSDWASIGVDVGPIKERMVVVLLCQGSEGEAAKLIDCALPEGCGCVAILLIQFANLGAEYNGVHGLTGYFCAVSSKVV